ncbi:hypothetical protein Q0O45_13275, partial [Staphylococcus aureus]|nr:hypothetical protein [Staphylococcus aureus]
FTFFFVSNFSVSIFLECSLCSIDDAIFNAFFDESTSWYETSYNLDLKKIISRFKKKTSKKKQMKTKI